VQAVGSLGSPQPGDQPAKYHGERMEDGTTEAGLRSPADFTFDRYHVDLEAGTVRWERVTATDLEDVLGGIARGYKWFQGVSVSNPYDPAAPLVMNLGALSGTRVMTGLRTFFIGFSPLKATLSGAPAVMWSAGSGSFGTRLRTLGIDEVVLTGRASRPTLLHLTPGTGDGPAHFDFIAAADLLGLPANERVRLLHSRFPGAHFAVTGPAAEHYHQVAYASVALTTDQQLETGDPKPRFCGRGGFGGVLASKNLVGFAADAPNPRASSAGLKEINREINLGPASARYRDLEQDRGGTWRTFKMMHEVGALPEFNFSPTGTDRSTALYRANVEAGPFFVKAEGCYLCGIRCHKNVYDAADGGVGPFRAKVDYEPIALLSSNLGIFDPGQALDLIALTDEMGMDSISLGVTLGYAMEYNRRHPETPIAGGPTYGDFAAAREAILAVAEGRLPEVGLGVKRLSERTGETAYAMHSKGVEYPAYLPQTNPGFPWALAGGHMSMRTFFLLVQERETGLDYWVDAITNRGPLYMLDDITGICKFAGISADVEAAALRTVLGLQVSGEELKEVVRRTYLRGYAGERLAGFTTDDYTLPEASHEESPHIQLPYFNTVEFFTALRERVLAEFDRRVAAADYL
jgi:aldehyde:ferredoxin oxidoreductase